MAYSKSWGFRNNSWRTWL